MSDQHPCRHEGEIRSLQSQNADQYNKLSELTKAVTELNLVVLGNGVPGLADDVREMKKEVDKIMQNQLTAEAVKEAVASAIASGVMHKRDGLSLARERAQVAVGIIGILGGVFALLKAVGVL